MIENFPHNAWYVAAWSHEIPQNALLDRTILGQRLVLYRTGRGNIAVLRNRCPHRSALLSKGTLEGDAIRCGYHGMLFDSKGRCVAIPGQDALPDTAVLRSYPSVEMYGWVWVWPGDEKAANPAKLPALVAVDDPDWRFETGYIRYKANAQLLHDNLLDFSHLEFVHAKSFGGGANWADKPNVERTDTGFHIERWMQNVPPAPFLRDLLAGAPNQDIMNVYDFDAPGILRIETQAQNAGTGTREAMSQEGRFHNISCQAVTPETETTSHYFYSTGVPKTYPQLALDTMLKGTLMAFEEDRAMIESQQAHLLAEPAEPLSRVALVADGPLTRMRALLRKQALAERSQ